MFKTKSARALAMLLVFCMMVSMLPTSATAAWIEPGDMVITPTNTPPDAIDGSVWVLTDSTECKKLVHTHEDKCFYKSCDHADGHLSTCYSEATSYELCQHADESEHTGSVTLEDVVTISGNNTSWKTDHPAYNVVYGVYKAAYDEAYAKAKFAKDIAGKIAGVAALIGKTFCYTTSTSAAPDKCTHTCSDVNGSCYTKICILEEHAHTEECFQYTWTLKADINKNGIADDVDTYYTVKYVNDGNVVYEKAVLVGMPTPTVENPSKDADAQYTYEFVGWDTPVADLVTDNVVYTAVYNNITNKYTVTWKDEDGTTLETDTDVEYGVMPEFNGEEPVKAGDNTVKYTFAGWTPAVEAVSGDVTYTATYTTRDVFTVLFVIDGEIVKTEYVVDGELVNAYNPARERYVLSAWTAGENAYDFTSPVTKNMELHASWSLAECVVTVKAQNATYTMDDVYPIDKEIVIKITPDAGYAVDYVYVNKTLITPEYIDGVATVKFMPNGVTEKYVVDANVVQGKLALNAAEMNVFGDMSAEAIFNAVYNKEESYPNDLTAGDVNVKYLAYSIELMGKTYDWWVAPGTDVSLKNFLGQFGLSSLAGYINPDYLPHEFGTQDVEHVLVNYDGSSKYPGLSAETTVVMKDSRPATTVNLKEGCSFVYGVTEEEILNAVFTSVVSDDVLVTDNVGDVTVSVKSLNAGKQTVTIAFAGNSEYAPSVAEVEITINKAAANVSVDSSVVKFGQTVNVSDLIHSNANCVEIAMGLSMGANATADAGMMVTINMPQLVDFDAIENETVKAIAEKLMDRIEDSMSGTMTVEELKDALSAALPYLESIEESGYVVNMTSETVESMIFVLEQMAQLDETRELTIKVTVGKPIMLKDAGVYLIAAVSSDMNYTTAYGGNYVVISPNGYRAELDWKVQDENGIVTLKALRNGYDLGAYVSSVYEGSVNDAEAHLKTFFFGVDKDGVLVITKNQEDLNIGMYTEFAFMMDLGNTMYYAKPITRSFLVAADIANVQFIDEYGRVNHDRIFEYGKDATMTAVAFNRVTGAPETNGTMTYMYMGLQANGELYRGAEAPTKPGTYTVMALFMGNETENVGAAIGTLVIKLIEPDFTAENTTVQYDGNEHTVTIKDNTGMNYVYIIVNENGDINVVMQEKALVAGASLTQAAEFLKNTLMKELEGVEMPELPEIPEEIKNQYQELAQTIKERVDELKKEFSSKTITVNAAFPSEIGVYQFAVIGFKDTEHNIAVREATLTIACEHVYDNACDADCNICGGVRETSGHKDTYIDRYESTCVKQGYEKIRCKACDEVLSETTLPLSEDHVYHNGACLLCGAKEHCEHDYVIVKELAPTCVEAGYVWTECSKCGAEKNYEVGEPTGTHGDTYVDRYESTCVKHGYEKIRCKVCNEILSETVLPLADEHVYLNGTCLLCGVAERCEHDYVVVKEQAPTCVEAGYVWKECSKCGAEKNHEVGEPTGEHGDTYIDRYESTCVKHGYERTRCKVCHEILSEVELPLSGEHVYLNGACLLCGVKEACEHDYVVVKELAPTCKEAGYVWKECSKCGAEKNHEVGEPTGVHGDTYIDRYESTCVKKGYEKLRCKVCHEVMSEIELPLSDEHVYYNGACLLCGVQEPCKHDYIIVKELESTCGEAGYVWTECSKCGAEKNYEVGEPTGEHTFDNKCDAECNGCDYTRTVGDHIYDNDCDADCNECGETRTPAEHVYQNDCDADCDVCGATREPAEHQYDNACDTDCNVCGEVRDVEDHMYDNNCDTNCNECGAQREVGDHVYDNACDVDCNECGSVREVEDHKYNGVETSAPTCGTDGEMTYTCSECGDNYTEAIPATEAHTYENNCDEDCNVCGGVRVPADHIYDNACDANCNECGDTRETEDHKYTSVETTFPTCGEDGKHVYTCSECGDSYTETIPATGNHTYQNDCDADCDVCGAEREPAEHVYDNDCDATCNVCAAEREVGDHVYDNACDADCNVCAAERIPADHDYVGAETTAPTCGVDGVMTYTCSVCGHSYEEAIPATGEHDYDNACDAECNECGDIRTPDDHVYDDEYDADCNVCGDVREVPEKPVECKHEYDNDCDDTCNLCGETREVEDHVYDDEYDADCNVCGETRDVPERPTEPEVTEPEETQKPTKPGTGDNAQTSDDSHLMLYFAFLLVSSVAFVMLATNRKKLLCNTNHAE